MASVVFSAHRSVRNAGRMEELRANLKKCLGQAPALADHGLFIGQVMRDPEATRHPTFSILVQCWEVAGDELCELAQDAMEKHRFVGLSALGLD